MKALFLGMMLMILIGSSAVLADYSCIDNTTIKYSTNITVDGIDIPIVQTEPCDNGCDNTTNSCSPMPASQNLILFGVIVGICVLGAMFWRWSR